MTYSHIRYHRWRGMLQLSCLIIEVASFIVQNRTTNGAKTFNIMKIYQFNLLYFNNLNNSAKSSKIDIILSN